jgi:chorismate-pyruvate lyase
MQYQLNNFQTLNINPISASAVVEPYVSLLSHVNYMTQVLSDYMDDCLRLNRLSQIVVDDKLQRVIKLQTKKNMPVMLAFIEISLAALSSELVDVVLEGKEPLGRLLLQHNIPPNVSCESLYKITSDNFLSRELEVEEGIILYGRNSLVRNTNHQLIANSFEVLSPALLSS